jgi:hypothetical protein
MCYKHPGVLKYILIFEKRDKCINVAGEYLEAGKSVAIGKYPSTTA